MSTNVQLIDTAIRKMFAALFPRAGSKALVRHVVERRVPVKGRMVYVREVYYAPRQIPWDVS